jgi:hypothetical protein
MNATKLIGAIVRAEVPGYEPFEARSYSGRGMRGRECVGVTVGRGLSSFQLGVAIAAAMRDDFFPQLQQDLEDLVGLTVREDSMGLDTIVYFPGVEWKDDLDDDDGEDDDEEEEIALSNRA